MTDGMRAIVLAICASILTWLLTAINTETKMMEQAYERGYAVQCIGKTGYYWECEE